MKREIIVVSAVILSITACKKDWTCHRDQVFNGKDTVIVTTFHGTKKDMKQYEKEGTKYIDSSGTATTSPKPGVYYIDTTITTCE